MDRQASARIDLECMLLDETKEPKALPLSVLENITNNFSPGHKIGSGGFAVVYKGVLDNGTVAVKKLSNTYLYEDKFRQEIECLMKAKHKNIVRFLGYCSDTQEKFLKHEGKAIMAAIQERILCFEYVPKGDLLKYISDASSGLEWRDRYKIIKGICEGLNYLHTQNIVHLDLKPANILMDDKMVPKITDFGVSRCFKEDQTRTIVTIVAGTPGYLAPEFTNGVITFKYDLYALGVIIMEILTGAKGYHEAGEVLERWSNRLETSQKLQDQLDVYLVELRFPVRTNTDEHTVFRLIEKSTKPWRCFASLPLYGLVPSRFTTYNLVVTTQQQERLPEETEYDLILQSSLSGDKKIPTSRDQSKYKKLFDEAKESGSEVCEVMLKTVFASQEQTMSAQTISKRIKDQRIISLKNTHGVLCSLDAHPMEPCIITGHQNGDVCIWNYDTQRQMDSFSVSKESVMPSYVPKKVHSVKVVSRKKWFVAGTSDGVIHVYNYDNKIQKLRSFRAASDCFITSMAVNPTRPYVLSSAYRDMKLSDWSKGWECRHSFVEEHSDTIRQVAFNPMDTSIFASASDDLTVKVWSIDSPESKYTLSGHLDKVNCLDFFTCDDRQYLITGSDDHTAKIWDMEEKACVHTMEAFMSPVISVIAFPDSPYLITGSRDGSVYFWSSSKFSEFCKVPRLERIVNFGSGGAIWGFGRFMGSRRIVIGQEYTVSIMAIDNEDEPFASEDSNENPI
ncbi:hypothetical protein ACQJBY_024860 [Aegilops geniculata]